ncbi:MAG: hypothetical protein QOF33_5072 [Thermomicrobiales bacterium]|nr:hypothetical protein [Thermomicrobiales bacterium]
MRRMSFLPVYRPQRHGSVETKKCANGWPMPREHPSKSAGAYTVSGLVSAPSTEVPPTRLLDAARFTTATTTTTRHPEDDRGDERKHEEENYSNLKGGANDSVEHPTKDQPKHETGNQSTTGPPQTFPHPFAHHLHRPPLSVRTATMVTRPAYASQCGPASRRATESACTVPW